MAPSWSGYSVAGGFFSILLQWQQLEIEGPLGEPDECNGDHGERSAGEHQFRLKPFHFAAEQP
jgi:hypothetical protein